VLGALGYHVRHDGKLDPNPLNTDQRTTSLHVYGDHAYDFGAGESFDPVTFIMAAKEIDRRAAADLYADAAGIDRMDGKRGKRNSVHPVRPPKAQPARVRRELDTSWLTPLTDAATEALEASDSPEAQRARDLLNEWRITPEVRRHLRLGVFAASVRVPGRAYATAGRERRMWWPYLDGDRAIYGSARAMYGEDPKTLVHATGIVGSRPSPYNAAAFDHAPAAGYLLMLEGEKDTAAALVALGTNAPALGLMGGLMPAGEWHDRVAALGVPAIVCFDADEAGRTKAAKLIAKLRAAGCATVHDVVVPAPHKDAADVLAAEGADRLRHVLLAWPAEDEAPQFDAGDPGHVDAPAETVDDSEAGKPGRLTDPPTNADADASADVATMRRSAERPPATQGTAGTLAPKVDDRLAWYPDTDAGNAERFVHYTRGTVRYAPGMGWLLWTGAHWEHDPSELVLRFALDTIRATHATSALLDNPERRASLGKHARASEALGRLRAMLDLARVRPEVHVLPDQLDADPWVLNTMSGLVNLRDATQRPHDAAALCTKLAPAVFDLDADHPALHALLDVLDQDGRAEYIRDTIGQALTGRSAKAVHVWTGPSGTVKSTTADAATAVLGAYAVSVEPSTLIVSKHGASAGGARADLVALRGARLAVSAEMPNGGRLDSELVKRLTGRDPITARPPYAREALTFIPGHTLVMHSNHEPRVDWTDDGMRARLAVVPFTVRPSNPDPRIRTALIEDADARAAVLAWAAVGAARWYRNGERAPDAPDVVQERTRALWANQDPFAVWAEDALVFGTGAGSFTPTADLARSYQAWCEANGERPMSARALGHWLAARADSHGLTSAKHGKAGTRGWTGLRLRGPTG
jgi:P4 family phage/plasmid primase-like protien